MSAATYQLVHAEVRVESCGSLAVEGILCPCPCTWCKGSWGATRGWQDGGRGARSPFVGRERELSILHDRLGVVRAGEGQVVSLVGPPGMGKTRLLTEFERRLAPDQVPWFGGQCLAYGQAAPIPAGV